MEKFRQEIEAAGCIHSLEQREMNTCMLPGTHHLLHTYAAQDPLPREWCCLSWAVLSILVNVSKMILHSHTNNSASSRDPSWRASSHRILDYVKMTIKTVIRGLPKIPRRTQAVASGFHFTALTRLVLRKHPQCSGKAAKFSPPVQGPYLLILLVST